MQDFDKAWGRDIAADENTGSDKYGFTFNGLSGLRIRIYPKNNGQTWNDHGIWQSPNDKLPITSVQIILETCNDCETSFLLSETNFVPPHDPIPATNEQTLATAKRYAILYAAQYFQQRAQTCLNLYMNYGLNENPEEKPND